MFPKSGPVFENLLVTVMCLTAGLVFLDRFGLAFAFPYMKDELGLAYTQLGLLMAVTAWAWAVSGILVSFLSDYLGGRSRLFLVTAIFCFSLATGFTGLATSFAILVLIRIALGVLEGPVIPLMQGSVLAASSPHRIGLNLGVVIAGVSLFGGALPPFLVGGLAEHVGWRDTFFYLAIPGLVLALLLFLIMRKDGPDLAKAQSRPVTGADVGAILKTRNVVLGLIGTICMIGAGVTFPTFAPSYLLEAGTFTPAMSAVLLTAYGLLGAAGTVIAPALSDHFGRKPVLIASVVCTVLLYAAMVFFKQSLTLLLVAMLLQLLAGGALTMMAYVIPGESVPHALTATTFAILLAVGEIVGAGGGTAIAGVMSDAYGLVASMWFCAALAAVALLVAFAVRDTAPRQRPGLSTPEPHGVLANQPSPP